MGKSLEQFIKDKGASKKYIVAVDYGRRFIGNTYEHIDLRTTDTIQLINISK